MQDKGTINYFDTNTPEYSVDRFESVIEFIKTKSLKNSSLIDVGCGTGNILELIKNQTKIKNLYGLDISKNCLLKAKERVSCGLFYGSILDTLFIESIHQKFDFVILGAVLHHLIGKTRKKSKKYALLAIQNSLKLLKKNGYLIIAEPVFYPPPLMSLIFYLKKIITKIINKRMTIFEKWNNLGAPVVTYYTYEQICEMISNFKNYSIIKTEIKKQNLNILLNLFSIKKLEVLIFISQV